MFKEDLQVSVAELVYGEPLRIPGELLTPTANPVDPVHLIAELCQNRACHTFPASFVHSDLKKCMNVFLQQDTTRWALETPLPGPVMERESTATLGVQQVHQSIN
jgi:hypothetical protein